MLPRFASRKRNKSSEEGRIGEYLCIINQSINQSIVIDYVNYEFPNLIIVCSWNNSFNHIIEMQRERKKEKKELELLNKVKKWGKIKVIFNLLLA